ncbi:MAG: NADH-quinone oxidoreductase subunit C [Desulfuromonadaceae bacterium]|nr:NADH-quinone oxidoreductase subunit C [Desulfuromonadaceae bacterium]
MKKSTLLKNGAMLPLDDLDILDYSVFTTELLQAKRENARISAYFARPAEEDRLEIFALMSRDWQEDFLLLRTSVGRHFKSLTPDCPQLHLFEREIAEQYGVKIEGHPWFKPVRFHQPWRAGEDAWGRDPAQHPVPGDMEFYRVDGEEVHEVAVGPVHAGIIEPGHFRFQCHGEEVMSLEISLGFQHRGLEPLFVGGPHPATLHQVEVLAGDTTIGHSSNYALILEALSASPAPPRGKAIRALALELERLANHVGDVGALSGDVGYLPTASFCGRIRGDYLNLTAEICGSRFGRGLVLPGGVGFDLDDSLRNQLLKRLAVMERETRGAIELFYESPSVLARLDGIGLVSADIAEAFGMVGVAARASGLPRDSRMHHPIGAYPREYDQLVIEERGDVYDRANIRRREIYNSISLVRHLLRNLPTGEALMPQRPLAPDSLAVAITEGWRGEVVHVGLTDSAGRFNRYKVVDPSFRNWNGLAIALRGEQISDFPLCNKSFNLSYCGFDL